MRRPKLGLTSFIALLSSSTDASGSHQLRRRANSEQINDFTALSVLSNLQVKTSEVDVLGEWWFDPCIFPMQNPCIALSASLLPLGMGVVYDTNCLEGGLGCHYQNLMCKVCYLPELLPSSVYDPCPDCLRAYFFSNYVQNNLIIDGPSSAAHCTQPEDSPCSLLSSAGDREINGLGVIYDELCENGGLGCNFAGERLCKLCSFDDSKNGGLYHTCPDCFIHEVFPETNNLRDSYNLPLESIFASCYEPEEDSDNGIKTESSCLQLTNEGDLASGIGVIRDQRCEHHSVTGCNYGGHQNCRLCSFGDAVVSSPYWECPLCFKEIFYVDEVIQVSNSPTPFTIWEDIGAELNADESYQSCSSKNSIDDTSACIHLTSIGDLLDGKGVVFDETCVEDASSVGCFQAFGDGIVTSAGCKRCSFFNMTNAEEYESCPLCFLENVPIFAQQSNIAMTNSITIISADDVGGGDTTLIIEQFTEALTGDEDDSTHEEESGLQQTAEEEEEEEEEDTSLTTTSSQDGEGDIPGFQCTMPIENPCVLLSTTQVVSYGVAVEYDSETCGHADSNNPGCNGSFNQDFSPECKICSLSALLNEMFDPCSPCTLAYVEQLSL